MCVSTIFLCCPIADPRVDCDIFATVQLSCYSIILIISFPNSYIHIFSTPAASVFNKFSSVQFSSKYVVSVMCCRFPNSITMTCCQLVTDLLATRQTILTCQDSLTCHGVANKSAASWQLPRLRGSYGERFQWIWGISTHRRRGKMSCNNNNNNNNLIYKVPYGHKFRDAGGMTDRFSCTCIGLNVSLNR